VAPFLNPTKDRKTDDVQPGFQRDRKDTRAVVLQRTLGYADRRKLTKRKAPSHEIGVVVGATEELPTIELIRQGLGG
jgi:hypothetical protein